MKATFLLVRREGSERTSPVSGLFGPFGFSGSEDEACEEALFEDDCAFNEDSFLESSRLLSFMLLEALALFSFSAAFFCEEDTKTKSPVKSKRTAKRTTIRMIDLFFFDILSLSCDGKLFHYLFLHCFHFCPLILLYMVKAYKMKRAVTQEKCELSFYGMPVFCSL